MVFDDEALKSFRRYGLHPCLVVCLKFVGLDEMPLVFLLSLSSHKQHSEP